MNLVQESLPNHPCLEFEKQPVTQTTRSPPIPPKEKPWIAFFCAIKHNNKNYLEDTLLEYDVGGYIMGLEIAPDAHHETDGEHFHFCVQMTEREYGAYRKRVFIDKFKLRGQAKANKPRQYGKVIKIENILKMKTYTLKDGDFLTNLTQDEIKILSELSYKNHGSKEELSFRNQLMADVSVRVNYEKTTHKAVGMAMIDLFQQQNKNGQDAVPLSKTRLDSYIRHYLMYVRKLSAEEIYSFYYGC